MDCKTNDNLQRCTCTYGPCDCIEHHLARKQLPGCCFPPRTEKTYDRSFEAFARAWNL